MRLRKLKLIQEGIALKNIFFIIEILFTIHIKICVPIYSQLKKIKNMCNPPPGGQWHVSLMSQNCTRLAE